MNIDTLFGSAAGASGPFAAPVARLHEQVPFRLPAGAGDIAVTLSGGVTLIMNAKEGYFYDQGGIVPPDGHPIKSDVFARAAEDGGGTSVLTRDTHTNLDVRGRYRAALRDATGAEVGWLRLRIGPYERAPRIYEAKLPAGVSDPLAVAAVLSLASELDWIEGHTQNVYQNDRGPLIQSIPIH